MSPRKRAKKKFTLPAPTAPSAATHVAPPSPPVRRFGPLLLLRAAHPRQAILTAAALTAAGALAGRPARELGLIFATVLVGQAVLGWHNDLTDKQRDLKHHTQGKPIAQGRLDAGTAWFALACGVLLVVPLAIGNGVVAGSAYLISLAIGLLGNLVFRRGWLSWLPWAAAYGLYPAFLSYGGWGGDALGDPPEVAITALAAALGVCVHFLAALPGLVPDNQDGFRHLPLRIALRTGAPRLLWITIILAILVIGALLVAGRQIGLAQ